MKKTIIILLVISAINFLESQSEFKNLNFFLTKNVSSDGAVNYKAIKANKVEFDKLVNEISNIKLDNNASKNDQLAYWINIYNIFTIKLLADNFPLKSIQNLDGGKPWDVKRITINGTIYSLNQIENDIIRAKFKDPRIHFAVNCGARSCPSLLNAAYIGSSLENQLNQVTKKFVNNPKYQMLTGTKIKISKIFDWYSTDFGNVLNFISKFSTSKVNKDAIISFNDYDWSLNN
jgi:hypothetical protein